MEFGWFEDDREFRHELRTIIEQELPPRWADLIPGEEVASEFVLNFCRTLGERGLLTPHWPSEYGGRDASAWQFIILGEELWSAGEPRGSQYMNVNWIGPAIINAGTPEQRAYHLARISRGDVFWCQGFSEREAGTDLAAMRTLASRDGDDYVINGEKVWTSYAGVADYCFLLARTDPETTGGQGISVFLVPTDTPGFSIEPIPGVLDIHEFNRLTFRDVRVPASARLGPENQGWAVVREALSHERIGGPRYARAAQVAERLEEFAREYGELDRDGLRTRFAEAHAACHAARLLVYRAIHERIKSRPEDLAVSQARVAIVRSERLVAELALDLFEDESLARRSTGNAQLKTAMIAGLGGGSVEVQLNMVARALLGSGRR
ncbi:acyl-CoA dehydrogenase family protein [Nocardia alni]|uniref:acyl-CoA dehydrogenase family protein n=1 Tax=Nocardia alni TaxID=2815723 RepID=UPI001C24B1C8|nr:acyl-CoA dehydrogenase family protein [Nocardia alni]